MPTRRFDIGKGAFARRLLVLALAGGLPFVASSASARWASVQEVTLGTAQVLEQGALTFGVVSPIAYGVRNDFMLESHPVLDLLLVPNLAGRLRVLDRSSFILSASASYRQSFFKVTRKTPKPSAIAEVHKDRTTLYTPGSPGEFNVGPVATWYPGKRVAVTAGAGFAMRQGTDEGACTVGTITPASPENPSPPVVARGCPSKDQDCIEGRCIRDDSATYGVAGSLQVHWLLQPEDLLVVSASARYDGTHERLETPTLAVWWAHAFRTALNGAHLLLGVSAGRFQVRGLLDDEEDTWPVFPFADLWWRL